MFKKQSQNATIDVLTQELWNRSRHEHELLLKAGKHAPGMAADRCEELEIEIEKLAELIKLTRNEGHRIGYNFLLLLRKEDLKFYQTVATFRRI
jgi:hypothetical protein